MQEIGDSSAPPTTMRSSITSIQSSNNNMRIHCHHQSRSVNDKLQRKLQKLEQGILSKNIQHDIMVNKEEMNVKRLKTKDIRIKNLLNDINKLREAHDMLVNEMTALQAENRGLASKLKENNVNTSLSSKLNEADYCNQSLRDILLNITNGINTLKEQNEETHCKQNERKQLEREFMNGLKNGQSEWMNNISVQINENMNKYNDKNNNKEVINVFCNRLDEMDKNNAAKLNNIYQNIKKQEIKLDALNTNYFQTLMNQKQKILINELKQDMKREIYSTKNELMSDLKETKNEIGLTINELSNDIKYQIPINNNNNNINNMWSDIMNENASKITNLEESINVLCKNNENTIKCIEEQISSQNNKFKQISDENASKTTNAVIALGPLFEKFYAHFQKIQSIQHTNIIQSIQHNTILSIQQNNNGMTQSFDSLNTNINKECSLLLKEMKTIKENKSSLQSEFNSISKNMQQIALRHDEIVNDSNKMCEMYNNLSNAIASINNKTHNNYKPAPQKNVYNGTMSEETVKRIKSMIISQIEGMRKSVNSVDHNLRIKLVQLLQEINSRNISLFNNMKQINDVQQKYILKESDLKNKHESELKNHLKQIQLGLTQLNKTQITLNKCITDKEILNKTTKDIQLYVRNDMMGEVQLIKNLCNEIYIKSQQLPHLVARNKDLKKFEKTFEDFTQNSIANEPVQHLFDCIIKILNKNRDRLC